MKHTTFRPILAVMLAVSLALSGAAPVFADEPCRHVWETVSAVNPTCTQPGNVDYYRCSPCGAYALRQADVDVEAEIEARFSREDVQALIIEALQKQAYEPEQITDVESVNEWMRHPVIGIRLAEGVPPQRVELDTATMIEILYLTTDEELRAKVLASNLSDETKYIIAGDDAGQTPEPGTIPYRGAEQYRRYLSGMFLSRAGFTVFNDYAKYAEAASLELAEIHESASKKVLSDEEIGALILPATGHVFAQSSYTAPLCEKDGIRIYTCMDCTESYSETIPMLGHDIAFYEDGAVKAPGAGPFYLMAHGRCGRCGTYFDLAGAKVSAADIGRICTHEPGDPAEENRMEATCTEEGHYDVVVRCLWCGERLSTDTKTLAALGHDWKEMNRQEATATEPGSIEYACGRCGEKRWETIPVHETHEAGDPVIEDMVEPTCTEGGGYWTAVYCAVGGETISLTYTRLAPLGHDYVITDEVPVTCTADGYTVYACSRCGDSYQVDYEPLGHDWQVTASQSVTATEDGYIVHTCSRCGTVYTEWFYKHADHTPRPAVNEYIVRPTCTESGSYYEVTYCRAGGEELSRELKFADPLGHEFRTSWHKDPTCTTEGLDLVRCKRCGLTEYVTIDPAGHTWDEPVYELSEDFSRVTALRTCAACGETEIETVPASIRVTVPNTCTEGGEGVYSCEGFTNADFAAQADVPFILPAAHSPEKTDAMAPACTEDGNIAYWTCSACGTFLGVQGLYVLDDTDYEVLKAFRLEDVLSRLERLHVTVRTAEGLSSWLADPVITFLGMEEPLSEERAKDLLYTAGSEAVAAAASRSELPDAYKKAYTALSADAYRRYLAGEALIDLGVEWLEDHEAFRTFASTCALLESFPLEEIDEDSWILDAVGHVWGDWELSLEATCTAGREEKRVCGACGEAETRSAGDPLGHDYTAEWTWAEDYASASALLTCRRDETHVETVAAEIRIERTEPGRTEDGQIVYTAVAVAGDQTFTDEKTVVLPASHRRKGTMGNDAMAAVWTVSVDQGGERIASVEITGIGISEDWPILAASFSEDGRFLGLSVFDGGGSAALASGAEEMKLFWVDPDSAPACEPDGAGVDYGD